MNNSEKDEEQPRLIAGGGFADPENQNPALPVEIDYHWSAYLASKEVEQLARAIEIAQLSGSEEVMSQLRQLWNAYVASGDIECLAKAIEQTAIYDNSKITKEIARILRDREPTRKFEKTLKQHELEVLYTHLEKAGHSKEKIYNHLASFKGVTPDSMKRDIMRRRKKVAKK